MPSYITAKGVLLSTSKTPNSWPTNSAAAETQTGTANNDVFHGAGGDVLVGGRGDDTYYLWDNASTVVEKASEGVDTIDSRFWGAVTLPSNVENLFLNSPGSIAGTGNSLSNIIVAGSVGATLNGKGGDDVLVGGAGADLFKVAAGNGSDAILNFKPSSDVILLQGYGISSFSQLQGLGKQTGSDTTFSFGNGEALVIRNVELSDLSAYDFGLKPATVPLAAGLTALVGEDKAATANGWYVVNNVWNAGDLTYGKDYSISSRYSASDLTAKTTFDWSFPVVTQTSTTIRAYPEVVFGPAPMSGGAKASDIAGVFPIKVGAVQNLTADYDVSYKGNLDGFNVAFDIWLTDTPNGGASTVTNEIMVWVHKGGLNPFGSLVGVYSDGAVTGKIYVSNTGDWTYTAIVLDQDMPKGRIDIDNILTKLKSLGIVSSNEYVASVELGAEVASGGGQLTINNLDLTLQTTSGELISVTGVGATTTQTTTQTSAMVVDLSGDDRVTYDALVTSLDGGAGHDTLVLNTAATVNLQNSTLSQVVGSAGLVTGFESIDASGASGAVVLVGSQDANKLVGGAFADTLSGGGGSDILSGGAGADSLDGGDGADQVRGDAGDDRIVYDSADSVIDGGAGRDVLILKGQAIVNLGNFSSSQVAGGSAYVSGFEDADATGATGPVVLNGSQYNNSLTGSGFADTISGGAGFDVLTGGGGADVFKFDQFTSADVDTITDFSRAAGDIIDLSGIDAIVGGTDDAFAYIGDSAFHGLAGELRYVLSGTGMTVQGDVDGNGVADFSIILTGSGAPLQGDFLL